MDRVNVALSSLVDIHDDFKIIFVIGKYLTVDVLQVREKL